MLQKFLGENEINVLKPYLSSNIVKCFVLAIEIDMIFSIICIGYTLIIQCSLMNITDKPPRVRLTSDSPAMKGSCISFTAALEFPPCQKEDSSGNLVYDEHCDDGMMEASGASYTCYL